MAAIIGGIMKAAPKKHLWQFLDGKLTVLWSGTVSRLPVRKGPAGIQVNLNTWNLKKNTGGFFSPSHEMEYRWKAI